MRPRLAARPTWHGAQVRRRAGVEWWLAYRGTACEHEPDMSGLQLRERGRPARAGKVRLCRMQFPGQRPRRVSDNRT